MKKRINITISPEIHAQATEFASQAGTDFSGLVTQSLIASMCKSTRKEYTPATHQPKPQPTRKPDSQTIKEPQHTPAPVSKIPVENPPLQSNERSEVPLESSSGGDATPAPETSPVDNRVPEKATPSQSNERSEVPIESLSEDDLFELGPDLSDTGSTSL